MYVGAPAPLVGASLAAALAPGAGRRQRRRQLYGYTRLIGKDGQVLGNPAQGAPTLGGNWNHVAALNPYHLLSGHAPQAPEQVVIDAKSARDGHLAIGDTTTVLVHGAPPARPYRGHCRVRHADSPGGASVVLFTTPVAQRFVAEPGQVYERSVRRQAGGLAAATR